MAEENFNSNIESKLDSILMTVQEFKDDTAQQSDETRKLIETKSKTVNRKFGEIKQSLETMSDSIAKRFDSSILELSKIREANKSSANTAIGIRHKVTDIADKLKDTYAKIEESNSILKDIRELVKNTNMSSSQSSTKTKTKPQTKSNVEAQKDIGSTALQVQKQGKFQGKASYSNSTTKGTGVYDADAFARMLYEKFVNWFEKNAPKHQISGTMSLEDKGAKATRPQTFLLTTDPTVQTDAEKAYQEKLNRQQARVNANKARQQSKLVQALPDVIELGTDKYNPLRSTMPLGNKMYKKNEHRLRVVRDRVNDLLQQADRATDPDIAIKRREEAQKYLDDPLYKKLEKQEKSMYSFDDIAKRKYGYNYDRISSTFGYRVARGLDTAEKITGGNFGDLFSGAGRKKLFSGTMKTIGRGITGNLARGAIGGAVGGVVGGLALGGIGLAVAGIFQLMKMVVCPILEKGQKALQALLTIVGVVWANEIKDKIKELQDKRKDSATSGGTTGGVTQELSSKLGENAPKELFGKSTKGSIDKVSGGNYVNPDKLSTEKIHGLDVVDARKLGLKGTIGKNNTIPYTTKENAKVLQALDNVLANEMGYFPEYTSIMGGEDQGVHLPGSAHYNARKLDFNVYRTAKDRANHVNKVKMTPEQEARLYKSGVFGSGALGKESDHYDAWIDPKKVKLSSPTPNYDAKKAEDKKKQEEQQKLASKKEDKPKYYSTSEDKPKNSGNNLQSQISSKPVKQSPTGNQELVSQLNRVGQ